MCNVNRLRRVTMMRMRWDWADTLRSLKDLSSTAMKKEPSLRTSAHHKFYFQYNKHTIQHLKYNQLEKKNNLKKKNAIKK